MEKTTISTHMRNLGYTLTKWGPMIFPEGCPWIGSSLAGMGEYSPIETDLLQILSDKDKVSVDVGANLGAITIAMSHAAKRVIAFEPVPFTYDLLQANIAMCRRKNISAYQIAATDIQRLLVTNGDENVDGADLGGVTLTNDAKGSILGKPLDVMLGRVQLPIALIKLDIEGGEPAALQGCEKTILKHQPYVFFEALDEEPGMKCVNFLRERGYNMGWFISMIYHETNWKNQTSNPWKMTSSFNILAWPKGKDMPFMHQLPKIEDIDMNKRATEGRHIIMNLGVRPPKDGS